MAVLPCLPRGHRRDFSPKREKSAHPYAQSSRPSKSTSFRTVCKNSVRADSGGKAGSFERLSAVCQLAGLDPKRIRPRRLNVGNRRKVVVARGPRSVQAVSLQEEV